MMKKIREELSVVGKEMRDNVVPILLAVIVTSGFVAFAGGLTALGAAQKSAGAVSGAPTARIVTIDPVELANAERALASQLLTTHHGQTATRAAVTLKLFKVGREMRATIRQIAGPNTLVLVKQAVIAGHVPDITKAVLNKLGLPAKAPTVDITQYLTDDVATTTMSLSQIDAALKARAQAQEKHSAAEYDKVLKHNAANVIP